MKYRMRFIYTVFLRIATEVTGGKWQSAKCVTAVSVDVTVPPDEDLEK